MSSVLDTCLEKGNREFELAHFYVVIPNANWKRVGESVEKLVAI